MNDEELEQFIHIIKQRIKTIPEEEFIKLEKKQNRYVLIKKMQYILH